MANRTRNHPFSVRLTAEELATWEQIQSISGLSKTDFFVKRMKNSVIKLYSFDETLNTIYKELRKIGVNLNQIAALANSGRLPQTEHEICNFQNQYYKVMSSLKAFLDCPMIKESVVNFGGDVP